MMKNNKIVFIKFTESDIHLSQGRLLFAVIDQFASQKYIVYLYNNLPEKLEEYARLAISLRNVSLTNQEPDNTHECIYIYDKEDNRIGKLQWRKKIRIGFDLFSKYWIKKPIIMPFPVHPVHAERRFLSNLENYRSIKKNIRVFFSGDTNGYVRNRTHYPKPKLTRLEIVRTLKSNMGNDLFEIKDASNLITPQSNYINKCVLVDTSNTWIDDKEWPVTLARTDFFLSPPGIVMPMCHNIIEAMAIGCIPITNYPEWFSPSLTHEHNCLAFEGKDDLISKMRIALQMKQDDIDEMSKNVIEYYKKHLDPENIIYTIENSNHDELVILMYTEKNTVRYESKLGKRSVLLQEENIDPTVTGLKRITSILAS